MDVDRETGTWAKDVGGVIGVEVRVGVEIEANVVEDDVEVAGRKTEVGDALIVVLPGVLVVVVKVEDGVEVEVDCEEVGTEVDAE